MTVEDITNFEKKYGMIPKGALVVMKTGWDQWFTEWNTYMGLSEEKEGFHFPGFGLEAAKFLYAERGINGIGIDTASLDHGPSADYPVH